jgi:phosphoglycerol transferase MdoB-like AlkP superfamily enzyme
MANFKMALLNKLNLYFQLIILTIISQILFRFLELQFLNLDFTISVNEYLSYALNFDSLIIILISIAFLPLYLLLSYTAERLAKFLTLIFFVLLIISNTVLETYYIITLEALSKVMYQFSINETTHIILSEVENRTILLVSIIIFISIIIYLIKSRINYKIEKSSFINPLLLLILIVISLGNIEHTTKKIHHFESKSQYLYYNSKLALFFQSFATIRNKSNYSEKQALAFIKHYQKINSNKKFISETFPLLNNKNYENVLGPFFTKTKTKPNVVIILSESLSRSFMGHNAKYNLTSFTDSLANQGLMWDNFLSNAEKSYGALPSILASLPNSLNGRGFVNLINDNSPNYPNHSSIISILNENDYFTDFYYGGWGEFDHINTWVKNCGINKFVDQEKFNEQYQPYLASKKTDFVWGYDDSLLFDQALSQISNYSKPFCSIIQTISLHSPYNIAPKQYFDPLFQKETVAKLGMDMDSIKNITTGELACILFSDNALKSFFEKSKKLDFYENTIFIITGDHGLNGALTSSNIDNYHVPLIIFSPLLKVKPKVFKGVSSHIDITPTLLALLKGNYQLEVSEKNAWFGGELDTSTVFQIKKPVYFNLGREDLPLALFDTGLYFKNQLYAIDTNFNLAKSPKSNGVVDAKENIEMLMFLNSYIIDNNKINQP